MGSWRQYRFHAKQETGRKENNAKPTQEWFPRSAQGVSFRHRASQGRYCGRHEARRPLFRPQVRPEAYPSWPCQDEPVLRELHGSQRVPQHHRSEDGCACDLHLSRLPRSERCPSLLDLEAPSAFVQQERSLRQGSQGCLLPLRQARCDLNRTGDTFPRGKPSGVSSVRSLFHVRRIQTNAGTAKERQQEHQP